MKQEASQLLRKAAGMKKVGGLRVAEKSEEVI